MLPTPSTALAGDPTSARSRAAVHGRHAQCTVCPARLGRCPAPPGRSYSGGVPGDEGRSSHDNLG